MSLPANFEIREIQVGTAEYDLELAFRNKVLREPLGLRLSDEELTREGEDIHLGAFDGAHLLGCLILTPRPSGHIKMRQVAVADNAQKSGVGRALVEASEMKAKDLGFSIMELNARGSAVPFYLKLGYEVFGEPFVEVTLPHRKMRKRL